MQGLKKGIIDTLTRYFPSDQTLVKNCTVTPLISGPLYFKTLKQDVLSLTGKGSKNPYIYIAGWWFDPQFSLEGSKGSVRLVDALKQASRDGVDVRVLAWVMAPNTLQNYAARSSLDVSLLKVNHDTMSFVNELRQEPTLKDKVVLNILSHPAGAAHAKMAIIGNDDDAVGFTGGIDMQSGRYSDNWHDIAVRTKGPIVQGFYKFFSGMWEEVRKRQPWSLSIVEQRDATRSKVILPGITCFSHTSTTLSLLQTRLIQSKSSSTSNMDVLNLQTLPSFNFPPVFNMLKYNDQSLFPVNQPLSYAPKGDFQVKQAWQKGISGAQNYIYMEDQSLYSTEVFDWINQAVKQNPNLRVVLLTGQTDPNDTPNDLSSKLFNVAIKNYLLKDLNGDQIKRIGIFSHQQKVIHAKTMIIDDQWATIGSANCMQRSLYTDIEHGIAFNDEDGKALVGYRMDLWNTHLPKIAPDMNAALDSWFALPVKGGSPNPNAAILRLALPLSDTTLNSREQVLADEVFEPDSRNEWGTRLLAQGVNDALSNSANVSQDE